MQFDTAKLIEDSRVKIDAQLYIQDRVYEVRSRAMAAGGTKEQMEDGTLFQVQDAQSHYVRTDVSTEAVYDLVGEIESRTHLTHRTIVDILKAIKEEKFLLVRKVEEFIAKVSVLINEVGKPDHQQHRVPQNGGATRCENGIPQRQNGPAGIGAAPQAHLRFPHHHSTIEANLPRSWRPKTKSSSTPNCLGLLRPHPCGNYSPDWAIVIDKGSERHVYFVAETKGSESDQDLREIEKLKIRALRQGHWRENGNLRNGRHPENLQAALSN